MKAIARREIRVADASKTEFTIDRGIDGTRSAYLDLMTTLLAGMAAELELLGDRSELSGGAGNSDLARATRLAAQLELDLGLGTDGSLSVTGRTSDEDVALRLERDRPLRRSVERTLAECLERARRIVRERHADTRSVATCLEEHGVWQAAAPTAAIVAGSGDGRRDAIRVRPRRRAGAKRRVGCAG